MTPAVLVLLQAEQRLLARVQAQAARLEAGEDVWSEYGAAATVLCALVPPESASSAALTTAQVAQQFEISPKSARKARREAWAAGWAARGAWAGCDPLGEESMTVERRRQARAARAVVEDALGPVNRM